MTDAIMLRAALRYLAGDSPFGRPVAVIPCCRPDKETPSGCTAPWHVKRKDHKAGKTPVVRWKPYQDRLPTEAEWRDWWRDWGGKCNIGCLAGAVSGGLLLDIDRHDPAADGWATLRDRALPVPLTPTVNTPSGGAHAWYAYPAGIEPGHLRDFQSRPEWPGLDGRGDGGFAVLPPSVHANGGTYAWVPQSKGLPLADAPDWLIDAFRKTPRASNAPTVAPDTWADLWHGPWTEGQRHGVACRLIGHLQGHGHTEEETTALLLLWNQVSCDTKPEAEIRAQVHDLYHRYGAAAPAPAPDAEWQAAYLALPLALRARLRRAQEGQQANAMAGALADALRAGVSPQVAYALALDTTDGDVETAQALYGRAARWAARPAQGGAHRAG